MKYSYIAIQPDGQKIEGTLDAQSEAEVLTFLAGKGWRPLAVKGSTLMRLLGGERHIIGQKVTLTDKMFLARYLALMLKVGTDLFKAIDILIADFKKPAIKAILGEIRSALERGQPFYSTFARYPQYFSPVFINMIKAGESSGTLERVLEDLSVSLEREKAFKGKVKAALIYPIILLVLSLLIVVFLLSFALPKIAGIFDGGGITPPTFSRVVFAVGLFLGRYIFWLLISFAALAGSCALFFWKSDIGRRVWRRMIYRTPFIRNLLHQIAIQRFAAVFSSLLRSGLSITEALETTADAVSDQDIRDALMRISREGVTKGVSLGESFKREPAFPSVVRNLVAISEKAGHLDEVLATLASFYETEIDAALKTFISFVEPVMLLFIGLVVGVIALSIIVPIYQLVGQF